MIHDPGRIQDVWLSDRRSHRRLSRPTERAAGHGNLRARGHQSLASSVAAIDGRALRRHSSRPRRASSCPDSRTGSIRSFFGYFPSNGALASVLGDYLSTGLGVLGLAWQSSPALTELEEVVDRLAAPDDRPVSGAWSGVIQDTASTQHAGRARVRARAHDRLRRSRAAGLQAGAATARRLRVGAEPQLGRQGGAACRLRTRATCGTSPVDAALRDAAPMRSTDRSTPTAPRARQPVRDRRDHRHDDDDRARSDRTRSPRSRAAHGLWLHVDAAMAGSAMILPECRWMWDGVEGADSLVSTPTSGSARRSTARSYYVRDPEHLVRVMSTNPSYLQIVGRWPGQEPARLGHSARPALPRAEAVVPDSRAGRRSACRRACVAISRTRAGSPSRCTPRRTGACSRPCRCRPSACATSRRASPARRSIATRRRGPSA